MKHPYEDLEGTPLWQVLEKAISSLVANQDLEETTDRRHIVGYLAKSLVDSGIEIGRRRA